MTSSNSPIVFHADAEHTGLRVTVVILLGVAVIILYFLINAAWSAMVPTLPDFSFIITCTSSIALGLVVIWGVEKGLKQVWHSGRSLILDESGISVQDEGIEYQLSWQGHLNLLYWQFLLDGYKRGGRERRVPKRWHCLALQVQEGENRVIVYTFMSPKHTTAFLESHSHGREPFHQINPAEVFSQAMDTAFYSVPSRPRKIPNEYLTGKDGSYWLAEQNRWWEGFELSAQEFEKFLNIVVMQKQNKTTEPKAEDSHNV